VTVHATGYIKGTGEKFWSTKGSGSFFEYQAGVGNVIAGWDQGCLGMRVGFQTFALLLLHKCVSSFAQVCAKE
jgi:FKBP-type peptidyl-prolyl cis-trans isomerase